MVVWTKSFNVKVLNDGGEVGLIGVDAFVSGSVNKVSLKRGIIDPEPSSAFVSGKINMKRKQFVGQVIKILRKMYKKRAKLEGRDLFIDKSADDVIFDEINKHGCHTMTVIENGRRVVKAAWAEHVAAFREAIWKYVCFNGRPLSILLGQL
jgi:hypothetical protein